VDTSKKLKATVSGRRARASPGALKRRRDRRDVREQQESGRTSSLERRAARVRGPASPSRSPSASRRLTGSLRVGVAEGSAYVAVVVGVGVIVG